MTISDSSGKASQRKQVNEGIPECSEQRDSVSECPVVRRMERRQMWLEEKEEKRVIEEEEGRYTGTNVGT